LRTARELRYRYFGDEVFFYGFIYLQRLRIAPTIGNVDTSMVPEESRWRYDKGHISEKTLDNNESFRRGFKIRNTYTGLVPNGDKDGL